MYLSRFGPGRSRGPAVGPGPVLEAAHGDRLRECDGARPPWVPSRGVGVEAGHFPTARRPAPPGGVAARARGGREFHEPGFCYFCAVVAKIRCVRKSPQKREMAVSANLHNYVLVVVRCVRMFLFDYIVVLCVIVVVTLVCLFV